MNGLESGLIVSSLTESIWHINIDRRQKRNAITLPMFAALADSLQAADSRDEIRCILVTGAGDHFCAGHDLDAFSGWPQRADDPVPRFLHAIADVRRPVVVAAQGSAIGIATTWLLHADWVVTSAETSFRLPFIDLGIVPEAASTVLLKQAVGLPRAKRLLLGGEKFSGAEAHYWGLVSEIVGPGDVVEAAWRRARSLASKNPTVLRQIKDWLHPPHELHARIDEEIEAINAAVLRNAKSKECIL